MNKKSNKIKVLLLSISLKRKGGVSNYINLLLNFHKNQNIQLKYFLQGPDREKNLIHFVYPFIVLYQLMKFQRVIKEYKPDIIHINPSLLPLALTRDILFLFIAKTKKIPILFFIHGWNMGFFQIISKNKIFTIFFKKIFNNIDSIVVLSNQFEEQLKNIGIKEEKIFILTTMVDCKKYEPEEKLFFPPYKILFCSTMKKEKGPYELLDAAKIVIDKYPDPESQFIFVGKGTELNKLKIRAKDLKINKNIKFLGYINYEEKVNIFKESHIFAFPTYHGEGFPTVVIEAMAAGLPIITTPNAGLRYAINNNKQGLLLKSMPAKPEEIAEKIILFLRNKELLEKISNNNIQEAKKTYDVDIVINKIEEIYKNLVKYNI